MRYTECQQFLLFHLYCSKSMIFITTDDNLRANKNNKNPGKMKEKTMSFLLFPPLFKITNNCTSKSKKKLQFHQKNILRANLKATRKT